MNMTITLYWWYLPTILFLAPFVYSHFRTPGGDYDFGVDVMLISLGCWGVALGVIIGRFI